MLLKTYFQGQIRNPSNWQAQREINTNENNIPQSHKYRQIDLQRLLDNKKPLLVLSANIWFRNSRRVKSERPIFRHRKHYYFWGVRQYIKQSNVHKSQYLRYMGILHFFTVELWEARYQCGHLLFKIDIPMISYGYSHLVGSWSRSIFLPLRFSK